MNRSLILIGLLLCGVLLVGCGKFTGTGIVSPEENPLTEEAMADQMLQYVTLLKIKAEDSGKPITDPFVLRAIDDVSVKANALQDEAHERQEAGKLGGLFGVNDNTAFGEVLLYEDALYTGYEFELSAAPGIEVYLSKHVGPKTEEELMSDSVKNLGPLQSYYGAQRYEVGTLTNDEWNQFRTVVFYSKALRQVIGLAQIRGVVR